MDLKGKIVFSSGKQGDYDIWVLDLSSKKLDQLTSGPYWNDCPKWSPDGKNIIFVSNRSGTPEIWVMNEDGSGQAQVTRSEKWHNTPDWSPDGKSIVFCANYDGNVDIYTMRLDGSDLKQVTNYPGMDFSPQFSPDGNKIIFTSQRSGNDDIWVYDLINDSFTQLTNYEEKDSSPSYSPDGQLIAFLCEEVPMGGVENPEIYLMDSNGKNRRNITRNYGIDRYVSWSPDGKSLIYTSSQPGKISERLTVVDIEHLKAKKIDFDREPLENEIEAKTKCVGVFCLLPEGVVRATYPEQYFGTERYPDWKW